MSFIYPRNIRFKCVKCGVCCGNTQERTRHVLLLDEEANEIAKATNKPICEFAIDIEERAPYSYEMKKTKESGKCVFLRENRCVIYSKRPLICRFYPFGFTNCKQQKTFYYTKECPGIGRGHEMNEINFSKLLRQANARQRMRGTKKEKGTKLQLKSFNLNGNFRLFCGFPIAWVAFASCSCRIPIGGSFPPLRVIGCQM